MPRDGTLPQPPTEPRQPTREEILHQIRQQNSGHLIEQVISLEADKIVLTNECATLRRRVAELEKQLAPVEPDENERSGA